MDILWPRWVARIGVTRATEACFLAADRQCTELPLLRLPRLVNGFRGSDPMRQTRDLARVGWRGLAPFLPIGPHERPRLADSFFRAWVRRAGHPPGRSTSDPKSGRYARERAGPTGYASVRPPPRGEGNCGVPTGASVRPSRGGGGEQGGGGIGAGGEGSRFRVAKTCLSGRGLRWKARMQPYVFPSSPEAASRQREEVSSATISSSGAAATAAAAAAAAAACRRLLPLSAPRSAASPPRRRRLRSPPPRGRLLSRSRSRAAGREVDVKEPQSGEVMKSSNFELARDGLEMVPSRSPGVGASQLGRDGPAPPLRRAAGALGQLCRQTCSGKFWRRSGTGGTPGRIWTDHIVQIHGGEPPRAHRRDGSRGTGPRCQRGESCSRRPADMAVRKGFFSQVWVASFWVRTAFSG